GALQADDGKHRFGLLKEFRIPLGQAPQVCNIATQSGHEKSLVFGKLGPDCALADQELRYVLAPAQHGMLDDRLPRVEVDATCIRAVLQQPASSLDVVGHCVAEKIGQCTGYFLAPQLTRRGTGPFMGLAAFGGFRPEQLEPERGVRTQRSIVESLPRKR